jgi:hypothetical protein
MWLQSDPDRILKPTNASLLPAIKHNPFRERFDPHSYDNDFLFSDVKFQLEYQLRANNLINNDYAKSVLQRLPTIKPARPDTFTSK